MGRLKNTFRGLTAVLALACAVEVSAAPMCQDVFKEALEAPCRGEICGVVKDVDLGARVTAEHWQTQVETTGTKTLDLLYTNGETGSVFVRIDPRTQKAKKFVLPKDTDIVDFADETNISSEKFLAIQQVRRSRPQIRVFNLQTRSIQKFEMPAAEPLLPFVWRTDPQTLQYISLSSGKPLSLRFNRAIENLDVSPDLSQITVTLKDSPTERFVIEVAKLRSNDRYEMIHLKNVVSEHLADVSAAARLFVSVRKQGRQSVTEIFSIERPNVPLAQIVGGRSEARFLADGKYLHTIDEGNVSRIYEVPNARGELRLLGESREPTREVRISGDRRILEFTYERNGETSHQFIDLATGKSVNVSFTRLLEEYRVDPSWLGHFRLEDGGAVIFAYRLGDSQALRLYIDPYTGKAQELSPEFLLHAQSGVLYREKVLEDGKSISLLSMERTHPKSAKGSDGKTVGLRLRKALESGRLDKKTFVELVTPYFSTGEYRSQPALTKTFLLWMSAEAPLTVPKYFGLYKDLAEVVSRPDERGVNAAFGRWIVRWGEKAANHFTDSNYQMPREALPILKAYFKLNPNKEVLREQLVRFAEKMLPEHLRLNPAFASIDGGVRMNLIVQSLRRELGLPFREITDVTLTDDGVVMVYGTRAVDDAPVDAFGLSAKEIGPLGLGKAQIRWTFAGRENLAVFSREPIALKKSLKPEQADAPNYKEIRAGGKLAGVIGISANLGEAFGRSLGKEYQEYYESKGLKFKTLKFDEAGAAFGFLVGRIRSGEVGYFIREGHAESRSEYAISVTPHMEIAQGVHPKTGETVYILIPVVKDSSAAAYNPGLTMSALGAALRSRPSPDRQFLYLESKCFGLGMIGQHAKNAAAPGFTPFGTPDMATTFYTGPGDNGAVSGVRLILDGLRGSRPYAEWTAQNADAHYVFPNTAEYFSSLGKVDGFKPTSLEIQRKINLPTEGQP